MMRFLVPIAVFAVLIPVFLVGLNRDPSKVPSPLLDKAAPEFELPSLEDPATTVGSRDFAGQLALVNVWATWCFGCRQEHDFLLALAAREEIPIYGLNWKDNRSDALRWLEQLGNPYVASAFDEDGRVAIDWGVYGAPETFLVGPDGTILHKHLSPLDEQVWQQDFVPKIEAVRRRQ